jgi:hypothetical protein
MKECAPGLDRLGVFVWSADLILPDARLLSRDRRRRLKELKTDWQSLA